MRTLSLSLTCSNERIFLRPLLHGPWGIVFTALLFSGLLFISGCRKPPPPVDGWVNIKQLLELHPNQIMTEDLDRRIAALETMRGHLTEVGNAAPPPASAIEFMEEFSALAEPDPSPQLNRHTDQFLEQRLDSYARLLERDRVKERDFERLRQVDQSNAEKMRMRQQLTSIFERKRFQLLQTYYLPVLNAKVAYNYAYTRAKDGSIENQKRLPSEETKYDEVLREYQAQLSKINYELKKEIMAAEDLIQRKYDAQLVEYDKKLKAVSDALLARKKAELAAADTNLDIVSLPGPMDFSKIEAGKLELDAPGLEEEFRNVQLVNGNNRQAALRDIDKVISQLKYKRLQLLMQIEQDVRDAADALAHQHNYKVSFNPGKSRDITGEVRNWLNDYWQAK